MLVPVFTPNTLTPAEMLLSIVKIYDCEVDAVHMALTESAKKEEPNIVIFIDSQANIMVISSVKPSKKVSHLNANFWSTMILIVRNFALQWLSSHCGISGNEFAESLTKA
ncbi:hypothetical protein NPIL_559501 [Nephila pilipes]|uniref:RNase H type-1 domain-containing protein n=1 Tax=Nephila pilipes TaxID=299642 RepID=A0A8X6MGZ2_NEPPI|nr:hypothetical protein NPIL_559501 [Nephila pilipes]